MFTGEARIIKRRGHCESLPNERNETGSKEEQEPGKFKNTDIRAQELRAKNKKRLKLKLWSKKPAHTATFCQDTTRSHLWKIFDNAENVFFVCKLSYLEAFGQTQASAQG